MLKVLDLCFYLRKVVLKELILTLSTLAMCGSLGRTDFNSFYFEGVVVLS